MMWHRHAAIGAVTGWMLLPFLPPDAPTSVGMLVACAALGALAPDLDAAESNIMRIRLLGVTPVAPLCVAAHHVWGASERHPDLYRAYTGFA